MKKTRSATSRRRPSAPEPRINGLLPATVTDINDPDALGRVKVQLKALPGGTWARLATLSAGPKSGSWFVPDVNDEVLVGFEAGDPRQPYVLGSLWSARNPPPETMDAGGANPRRVLRSPAGVAVTLNDQAGQESVVIETPGGQRIVLVDGPGAVQLVDANGNSVSLAAAGITINAAAKVTINASQVSVSASLLQVDAGMARFSGVVQCGSLVANSVVSSSYSPGAGNIW